MWKATRQGGGDHTFPGIQRPAMALAFAGKVEEDDFFVAHVREVLLDDVLN